MTRAPAWSSRSQLKPRCQESPQSMWHCCMALGSFRRGPPCGQQSRLDLRQAVPSSIQVVQSVTSYATSGALALDARRADSDLRAYRQCNQRDCTAGALELIYRCYHRLASTLSVSTTGRAELPADGPRRRRRRPRDSYESAVGRLEQLAHVDGHDTTWSISQTDSNTRDSKSEPLLVSVDEARAW